MPVVLYLQLENAKDSVKLVLDHLTNKQTTTHLEVEKGNVWEKNGSKTKIKINSHQIEMIP